MRSRAWRPGPRLGKTNFPSPALPPLPQLHWGSFQSWATTCLGAARPRRPPQSLASCPGCPWRRQQALASLVPCLLLPGHGVFAVNGWAERCRSRCLRKSAQSKLIILKALRFHVPHVALPRLPAEGFKESWVPPFSFTPQLRPFSRQQREVFNWGHAYG